MATVSTTTTRSETFLADLRSACADVLAFDGVRARYNNRLTVEMFQETGPTVLKLWDLMAQWEEVTEPRIIEIVREFYRDLLNRLDTLDQADPDEALVEAIHHFFDNADELDVLAEELEDLDIDDEQLYYGFLTATAAELAPDCGRALVQAEKLLMDST